MALDTSLISYWKLDESSGNATDSVGSNTLTNVGTATYSAGKLNNGVDLNGSSQYLNGGNVLNLTTGAWTFSAWIKVTTTGSFEFIGGRSESSTTSDWYMRVTNTDKAEIQFRNGASSNQVIGSTTVADGNWHHIVGLRNGTNVLLYVDGVLDGSATDNNYNCSNSLDFHLGADSAGALNFKFNGQIDEVGVWSRALSADEVLQIHNSGRANEYPFTATPSLYGAISYYKLDESSGNASDSIRSKTLTNVNTVTYGTGKINNGADFGSTNSNRLLGNATNMGIDGGAVSISCWFKISTQPASGEFQNIIRQSSNTSKTDYFIRYENNGGTYSLNFTRGKNGVGDQSSTVTGQLTTGTWYHAVLTYDTTTLTSYLDTSSNAISASGSGSGANPDYLTVGGWYNSALTYFYPFKGMVDEIGVWSRALTSGEVSTLYNSGTGNQYPFVTAITFAISETLALTESISNLRTRLFSTSETATLTETVSVLKGIAFSIAETLGLVETFTSTRTRLFTVAESLGLVEVMARIRLLWTNTTKENTTWTDQSKNSTNWTNQNKN